MVHMSNTAATAKTTTKRLAADWSDDKIARLVGGTGQMADLARREQRRRYAA